MDFLRKIFIKSFLNDYKVRLIHKTDYYDKYYLFGEKIDKKNLYDLKPDFIDENIVVNTKMIDNLTSNQISELYNELRNEETYLN